MFLLILLSFSEESQVKHSFNNTPLTGPQTVIQTESYLSTMDLIFAPTNNQLYDGPASHLF